MTREILIETNAGDYVSLTKFGDERAGWHLEWAAEAPGIAIEPDSAPDSNVIVHVGTGQIAPAIPELAGSVWARGYDRLLDEVRHLQTLIQVDAAGLVVRTVGRTLRLPVRTEFPRGWVRPGRPEGFSHVTPVRCAVFATSLEWTDVELNEYVGLVPL